MEREWQPGTTEDKQRARAALAGTLDAWLVAGDALLTPEGGWPLGPPASSSETWPAILYLIAHASDAAARYSETVMRRGSSEALEPYARHAQIEIDRLAALIIRELGESHIDRYPILDEADAFVDEVDDEHNGMLHTADAIGSLLQARLVCAEDQLDLPASELATRLSGSSRRCSLSARASLSDPTRRAVLPEHDQRFHRILNDYLERCAGDYAELLRRGYVSSPDGVDLEQIQTVASCAFTLGGPDLASKY